MNKKEFLARLEELDLPKSEFRILSGGALLLWGIRERTEDIDLAVSEKLADQLSLREQYPLTEKSTYTFAPDVEMIIDNGLVEYEKCCGYDCESLESILAFKRRMMREKDLRDIPRIEEFLEGREILELEKSLFKLRYMSDSEYMDRILRDDYLELGKSGRFFDKSKVIEDLAALTRDRPIRIFNFEARKTDGVWLVHYITKDGDELIYRTSIWSAEKQLFFHQASHLKTKIELEEF